MYACMHEHVFMFVCMHVCMYACMHACIYIFRRTHLLKVDEIEHKNRGEEGRALCSVRLFGEDDGEHVRIGVHRSGTSLQAAIQCVWHVCASLSLNQLHSPFSREQFV